MSRRLTPSIVLGLAVLVAAPAAARAQAGRQPFPAGSADTTARAARTFGTSASTSHTVQAFLFNGLSATDTARFAANVSGSRYCTQAPCSFETAVMLPAGALVTGIELEACDSDPTASVTATLFVSTPLESGFVAIGATSTGPDVATPGCKFFLQPLAAPETIDNYNNTYQVEEVINGQTLASRFQAVRLYYNLQVSPAPATASFEDVPVGHPFFAVIEALRAAGITAGCSTTPSLFCPDDPVTRKAMAAFIAKALGLHWVP